MTNTEVDLLESAIDFADEENASPGQTVITYGEDRFIVLYVFQEAYGFRFFDSMENAQEEAQSPSINI